MKKNIMMRLSALLLVAVLLTTCVISGTFAKYTTADSATDTAKVAAWGIKLKVTGDDVLYDDEKTGDEVTAVKVTSNALAAPGTYQKLATVNLTGTPEVAYSITVDVDLTLANWASGKADDPATTDVNETVYCPVVFTVDGAEYKIDATNKTTADLEIAIENAIKSAICGEEDGSATKNAGDSVPTTANAVLIDWMWAFNVNDKLDTVLGNADTKATIGFSLKVTVEQVD